MRRRKYRERRNSAWERKWLQRELVASGMIVNGPSVRKKIVLPPSTTSFGDIAVRATAPPKRRRRASPQQEIRFLN